MTELRQCEYVIGLACTLTGRLCICIEDWIQCTRRIWANDYERNRCHRSSTDGAAALLRLQVVCSEDDPQPPLQGT